MQYQSAEGFEQFYGGKNYAAWNELSSPFQQFWFILKISVGSSFDREALNFERTLPKPVLNLFNNNILCVHPELKEKDKKRPKESKFIKRSAI